MVDFNSEHNLVVWTDIPVFDLVRTSAFYATVLNVSMHQQQMGEFVFAVTDHNASNRSCLILATSATAASTGMLVYFNAHERIRDALAKAVAQHSCTDS